MNKAYLELVRQSKVNLKCKRCNEIKHKDYFSKANNKIGYQGSCKKCYLEFQNNKLTLGKMLFRRGYIRMSNHMSKHFKGQTLDFREVIGISEDEYADYIKSKFQFGMSFENKTEWHVDHVIPLITAKSIEELIVLLNYNNTIPMWAKKNISKGGKLDFATKYFKNDIELRFCKPIPFINKFKAKKIIMCKTCTYEIS